MACIVLLWCSCARAADTHAYLLRGWFGVFSTGMDELAAELKAQGIKANAIGHLSWSSTVSKIVQDKASGKLGALVLVGHSQGAINAIEIARALETHKIPVDLLVTLSGQRGAGVELLPEPRVGCAPQCRPRLPRQALQH
jgi:surfactin synthase thioesterase subunit